MGRSRTLSSSSTASSSSSDGNYKRTKRSLKKTRSHRSEGSASNSSSTTRSTHTPPLLAEPDKTSRLELLVEKLIEHQAQGSFAKQRIHAKPECIPEFTHGNPNLSSSKWIEKIEQLGAINNWDEPTTIFYMQTRLGGLARRWYDNLPSYQLTWTEGTELILKAFPDLQDFATLLRKVVNRCKVPTESWERYYFVKIKLLNACEISGKKGVSCIINGINDSSIQASAKAGRYETSNALYAEYLSTLILEDVSSNLQKCQEKGNLQRRQVNDRLNEPPFK